MRNNMIINKNKRIGIWGFGIVGKAAVNYFHTQGYHVGIMDKRTPTEQESLYLKEKNITWYQKNEEKLFFSSHDFIIPSPGVNIDPTRYATHGHKWIHELDFFYASFHKPIIAITGSIGKTSTTYILGKIFEQLSIPVAVGGNIGTATFDLINQQNNVDYAVLEVSSFQLNHCTQFAPTLAILTNIYPNHLDHHATEDEYFSAKQNIFRYQKNGSISLVPFMLREKTVTPPHEHTRAYFTRTKPHDDTLAQLTVNECVYYIENNIVMRFAHHAHTPIYLLTPELLNFSFVDNILLLISVCDLIKLDSNALQIVATTTVLPEHRIEKVGTINNIDFYNDSKGTTTVSTFAAVEKLQHRPLHLFLGGLSKGIDRAPFVAQLKNRVQHIYCFGKEAESLYTMCISNNISATYFATLDSALAACTNAIKSGDCVLLSPAGSSYDLYENYEQRGKHFKELVIKYIENNL